MEWKLKDSIQPKKGNKQKKERKAPNYVEINYQIAKSESKPALRPVGSYVEVNSRSGTPQCKPEKKKTPWTYNDNDTYYFPHKTFDMQREETGGRGPFFHDWSPYTNGRLNFQNIVYCKHTDTQYTVYDLLLPSEDHQQFIFWNSSSHLGPHSKFLQIDPADMFYWLINTAAFSHFSHSPIRQGSELPRELQDDLWRYILTFVPYARVLLGFAVVCKHSHNLVRNHVAIWQRLACRDFVDPTIFFDNPPTPFFNYVALRRFFRKRGYVVDPPNPCAIFVTQSQQCKLTVIRIPVSPLYQVDYWTWQPFTSPPSVTAADWAALVKLVRADVRSEIGTSSREGEIDCTQIEAQHFREWFPELGRDRSLLERRRLCIQVKDRCQQFLLDENFALVVPQNDPYCADSCYLITNDTIWFVEISSLL